MESPQLETPIPHSYLENPKPFSACAKSSTPLRVLPPDILVLIVDTLSNWFCEIYAPLICSHVCRHWRETITGTPLLWTYIDTSRGQDLTRLWLANARDAALNVCFRELVPSRKIMEGVSLYLAGPPPPLFMVNITAIEVRQRMPQWRSLNIALNSINDTAEIMEDLGNLPETLLLDYLTIDRVDESLLVVDDGTVVPNPGQIYLADASATRSIFRKMNVQPTVLRIDTYPIGFSPVVFSPRLTVLEVFTGGHYTHPPDIHEWHQILSHTPQLVQLRLCSSRHRSFDLREFPDLGLLELTDLQRVELSGLFAVLGLLFIESSLPALDYLLLDYLGTYINIPRILGNFARTSPSLTQVCIGSICFSRGSANQRWWAKAFQRMRSLRVLKFFEMEWREVVVALQQLSATPHNVKCIELKRVWDIDTDTLSQLLTQESGLPRVEYIDCIDGRGGWCNNSEHALQMCESESGSNYSDNSSFIWESEASTDSEMSYGNDEGSQMGVTNTS